MKPGYKTTEFYIALVGQVLSLLTLLGAVPDMDRQPLEKALTNAVMSIFALVGSVVVVVQYIRSRTAIKTGQVPVAEVVEPDDTPPDAAGPPDDSGPPNADETNRAFIVPAICLALLFVASPVQAESASWLPWRRMVEQKLNDQQSQLNLLLAQKQIPAPQQAPIIIVQPPRQELPIAGLPRQELPVPGVPRQEMPNNPPRQELPAPGMPRQELPPNPPRQELPSTNSQRFIPALWR